jgi:hypothetical protein
MRVGGQRHAPTSLPSEKRHGTHCTGGWAGPQGQSRRLRKISPPPGFDPGNVQFVARLYTDYAILGPRAVKAFT